MKESPIRMALVEDHSILRETLAQQLPTLGPIEIVGSYATATAFLQALPTLQLHLVLMDISMPDLQGPEAARQVLAQRPDLKIITLTSHEDTEHYRAMVEAGASGYVYKSDSLPTLWQAIQSVHAGNTYFSPQQLQAIADMPPPAADPTGSTDESPFHRVLDDSLWIRKQDKLIKLRFADILWVEADGNYSTLHTERQDHVIVSNLKNTATALQPPTFMRVHRSYLVNLKEVDEISEIHLWVRGQKIPVGRSYRAQLLEALRTI